MKDYFSSKKNSYVEYSGDVMAIYSRQPVTVYCSAYDVYAQEVRLTLLNPFTGSSIVEERDMLTKGSNAHAYFDISRMLQLVCDAEARLHAAEGNDTAFEMSERVTMTITLNSNGSWNDVATITIHALHACCDWGEEITSSEVRRRFWVNYPQTISAGIFEEGSVRVSADSDWDASADTDSEISLEVKLMELLADDAYAADLYRGKTRQVHASYSVDIKNGEGSEAENSKTYTLVPQLDKFGSGVYLRWLHRDGTIGYWLFKPSKETHQIAQAQSFARHISGNPASPKNGGYPNSVRQSFSHAQNLTIGTANVTEDEYSYLLGLAESPLVEMLVGGTREEPVWARVSVGAATYTKNVPKSGLSRLRDFELTIALPERNTARL